MVHQNLLHKSAGFVQNSNNVEPCVRLKEYIYWDSTKSALRIEDDKAPDYSEFEKMETIKYAQLMSRDKEDYVGSEDLTWGN